MTAWNFQMKVPFLWLVKSSWHLMKTVFSKHVYCFYITMFFSWSLLNLHDDLGVHSPSREWDTISLPDDLIFCVFNDKKIQFLLPLSPCPKLQKIPSGKKNVCIQHCSWQQRNKIKHRRVKIGQKLQILVANRHRGILTMVLN